MSDWAERVTAFQKAGGQTTKGYNHGQANKYSNHVNEEAVEMMEAFEDGDDIKAIDGACDLIVVAIGFLNSMGVDPDKVMKAVLDANDRKIINGEVYKRPDGQIGKPPGWYGPEKEIGEIFSTAIANSNGIA